MKRGDMHVNDPTTLISSAFVFLLGSYTAWSGTKSKQAERKRQEVLDADAGWLAKIKAETERAERYKADSQQLQTDCDKLRIRAGAAETEIDARNAVWAACRTNYPEVASLIAVPGAIQCLRDHRDRQSLISTS